MRCPKCRSTQTKVVDSRAREDVEQVYRRRSCLDCQAVWTTYEIPAGDLERLRSIEQTQADLRELAVFLYAAYGPDANPATRFRLVPVDGDRRAA